MMRGEAAWEAIHREINDGVERSRRATVRRLLAEWSVLAEDAD
jgi:hypothetical protein